MSVGCSVANHSIAWSSSAGFSGDVPGWGSSRGSGRRLRLMIRAAAWAACR